MQLLKDSPQEYLDFCFWVTQKAIAHLKQNYPTHQDSITAFQDALLIENLQSIAQTASTLTFDDNLLSPILRWSFSNLNLAASNLSNFHSFSQGHEHRDNLTIYEQLLSASRNFLPDTQDPLSALLATVNVYYTPADIATILSSVPSFYELRDLATLTSR